MTMRYRTAGAICAALMMAPAAHAGDKVAPKDIQSTFFTSQPFTASTPSKVKFQMVFTPDGKATREPAGKTGAKGEGTWKLTGDGFCTAWNNAKPNCYTLVSTANNKWSVMKGPALVAVWTK
jgi:hypothetical protein